MTIKGLEPEIQKIIAVYTSFTTLLTKFQKQKQEQITTREQYETELRKQRDQLVASYESQLVTCNMKMQHDIVLERATRSTSSREKH